MTKRKLLILALSIAALLLVIGASTLGVIYQKSLPHFDVADTLPDGGGKKATVILLGGQSNASGCSHDEYLKKTASAEDYARYEQGFDNVYINYFVSDNNRSDGFVNCSVRQGEFATCFGPELGIADKLNALYPDEEFFIIKYAWGGTNLFEQWLSPSSKGKTGKLWQAFTAFVQASIDYLEEKNYAVTIEGMCWMQGESDSFSTEHAVGYETHLLNFIKDMRHTFRKHAASDGIAFVDAYIADNPIFWVYCDEVNAAKTLVAARDEMNALVDTHAAGLICTEEPADNPDIPHYDSQSELKLGHLFAEKLAEYLPKDN